MSSTSVNPTKPHSACLESLNGIGFDWLMAALSTWLLAGLYIDGWAHVHITNLETFFTPWHGVLYSGFLAQASLLVGLFIRNLWRRYPLTQTLPAGYHLSLLGVVIFIVGGIGDVIWHRLFGIEVSVEALLSPTHTLLAVGGGLMITGPLRAGILRGAANNNLLAHLPMILSATFLLSLFSFFTEYAHPFATTWVTQADRPLDGSIFAIQAIGITSFLFQSALLTGLVLVLLRSRTLPPGTIQLAPIICRVNGSWLPS